MDHDSVVNLSLAAEIDADPREIPHGRRRLADEAHGAPPLFGWLAHGERAERARRGADVTRPRLGEAAWVDLPAEQDREHEKHGEG